MWGRPGPGGRRGTGYGLLPGMPEVDLHRVGRLEPAGRPSRRATKKASPECTRFSPFTGSHFVPASLYSAAIYLRVSSAGPLVSSSDAASELSGL